MAKSGNPNPQGPKADKRMRDALMLELHRDAPQEKDKKSGLPKGPRKETYLRRIARKLVEAAADGQLDAVKEINNRIDGKAVQPMANDPDNPLIPNEPESAFGIVFVKSATKR